MSAGRRYECRYCDDLNASQHFLSRRQIYRHKPNLLLRQQQQRGEYFYEDHSQDDNIQGNNEIYDDDSIIETDNLIESDNLSTLEQTTVDYSEYEYDEDDIRGFGELKPEDKRFIAFASWQDQASVSNEQYQNFRKIVFKYYKIKLPYLKKKSSQSCAAYTGADKDATECKGSSKKVGATHKGCNLPRWKTDKDGNRIPYKRFEYIPLIPRLVTQYRSRQFAHTLQTYPAKILQSMRRMAVILTGGLAVVFGYFAIKDTSKSDGPAIAEFIGIKTPGNAKVPCRHCMIKATQVPPQSSHWYIPHTTAQAAGNLPLRQNLRLNIEQCTTPHVDPKVAAELGINRASILLKIPTLHFPRNFPIDTMHCILLNIVKNAQWYQWAPSIRQKSAVQNSANAAFVRAGEPSHGLDGDEILIMVMETDEFMPMEIDELMSMEVDEDVQPRSGMQQPRNQYMPNPKSLNSWNRTLLHSRQSLPPSLGTIPATLQHVGLFTAAEWHAMLEVYGPSLFYQHITDEAHHVLCTLNRIWCKATQHSLSDNEIDELEQNCRKFVAEYETVYFAKDPARIKSCTINIHALLHIAEFLRDNRPARCWWSFPLERYLQLLKQQARSKSHISQSIENALLRHEQASTLHLLECFLLGNEHPDAKDATVYPKLVDLIEFPNRTRDKYMPLSNTLRRRIGVADPSDISYWARCKLDKLTTVGSSYSQKKERQNYRCDNTVCYTEVGDSQRCWFGTVWGFLSIDNQADCSGWDLQFALIVRWKGVEADLDRQQVTFDNYNGNLDLVSTDLAPFGPHRRRLQPGRMMI
ncbi:hypothetical protein K3495_g5434 [Podosphaera aphanis]|nr:hypothetical protein K3495_g5434 [Podosphaera aphanis]